MLSLDGKPMDNGRQLQVGLYRRVAGDVVSLEILREGHVLNVPVAMAERQNPFAGLPDSIDPRENLVPRLGILAVNFDQQLAEMLSALRVRSGVVVVSTVAGAIDDREGGLAVGDIIYAVNRAQVGQLSELRAALDVLDAGDSVVLQIERRGQLMYLAFTVE